MKVQDQISNALLLRSCFIDNIGLLNGKMGIAIYFFYIARLSENIIYEKYAEELIDDIYDEISTDTPLDIENGLAGIGLGIEYLAENNFVEGDTNEVLEEFDNVLSQEIDKVDCKMSDALSIGIYFTKRWNSENGIKNPELHQDRIFENILTLLDKRKNVLVKSIKKNEMVCSADKELYAWNYFLALGLLIELKHQNDYNDKVDKLFLYLILPLNKTDHYSKNHLFKLLLLGVIKRMQSFDSNRNIEINQTIVRILNNIQNVNRADLVQEVKLHNKNKTWIRITIAFVYQQLNYYTDDITYLEEIKFWRNECNKLLNNDILSQLDLSSSPNDLGIFKGIAGIGLLNSIKKSQI